MGYSSIRQYVMGSDAVEREATPEEVEKLQAVVKEGLDAGAYGISFNHNPSHVDAFGRPIPCRLANFDELKAVVSMLKGRSAGTIQMSGNPNPSASIPDNADALAEASGRPVLWSSILQLFSQPEVWKERCSGGSPNGGEHGSVPHHRRVVHAEKCSYFRWFTGLESSAHQDPGRRHGRPPPAGNAR